jgi:uncharacterized protein (TIGR02594 family)
MDVTLFSLAQRYIGVRELKGLHSHPLILWWHSLCNLQDTSDEVPWCSSFLNGIAWELRLPRSKSAAARSWLTVGIPITTSAAIIGDVVILKRGDGEQPGPEVTSGAPGHVGLFAGWTDQGRVLLLGGNQSNEVSIAAHPASAILGVRRLT